LNNHGSRFQPSDRPILEDYIRQGWFFVVAKVAAEKEGTRQVAHRRFVAPLIIRFPSNRAVYPMRPTGTLGHKIPFSIYVLGRGKMDCNNLLPLTFAGEYKTEGWKKFTNSEDRPSDKPAPYLLDWEIGLHYLTKFKGYLAPEQMQKDLSFVEANDNKPFREKHIQW